MRVCFAAMIAVFVFMSDAQAFSLTWRAQMYEGRTASELGLPARQWCADFMNMILGGGTRSRAAKDFARYGTRTKYGCIGCIAVMSRGRNGGHVGVVKSYDAKGNPIIISGNHNGRVGEGTYSPSRVYAYRMP